MQQHSYITIIREQTERMLWEAKNIIDCIPCSLWDKTYCGMPMWQHVYHMLHSLDLWFINPRDKFFIEPAIHEKDLNNLNVPPIKTLTKSEIEAYYYEIKSKIDGYLTGLRDEDLLSYPPDCEYTKFTLILAQFRHLHCHMGMLMGFIINDVGKWPRVLGLEGKFPAGEFNKYF
jgi:hypothetical protein